jgi:predicted GNAT family acetyltransferase
MSEVIVHNPDPSGRRGTFDLTVSGNPSGFLSYSLDDEMIVIDYVQVDPSLRGQGMGEKLVRAAVLWARESKRKIFPLCSYSRAVMTRTVEYHDVLQK